MFKTIALSIVWVAVAGIALLLVAAAFRPDTFRVQRSVRIAAPPAIPSGLAEIAARILRRCPKASAAR